MSLDLDWSLLTDDSTLSTHFKNILNKSLSSAKRPDFIGPIEITNLDLGQEGLDIEVTKIGDLWKDFVEIDEPIGIKTMGGNKNGNQSRKLRGGMGERERERGRDRDDMRGRGAVDEDGDLDLDNFDQRRREKGRGTRVGGHGGGQSVNGFMSKNLPVPQTHRLQTLRQYDSEVDAQMVGGGTTLNGMGGGSGTDSQSQNQSNSNNNYKNRPWSAGLGTSSYSGYNPCNYGRGNGGVGTPMSNGGGGYFSHWQPQPAPPAPATRQGSFVAASSPPIDWGPETLRKEEVKENRESDLPTLQIHATLTWPTTSLRLTFETSLLINYPSPMFMSLPLQITATGFILQAGVILALEGEKRRVHVSLLEVEEDEEVDQNLNDGNLNSKGFGNNSATSINGNSNSNPVSDLNASHQDPPTVPGLYSRQPSMNMNNQKPHSIGARLLPSMTFESSVGQNDKHTLRNVGKVEKFVLDLVRKGIEDEVSLNRPAFKNFWTAFFRDELQLFLQP